MADYFLDTSAIVKRYVQEKGTIRINTLADPAAGHFLYVARIADMHVLRAYDAVQLAAALDILRQDAALILVSADADLNAAASAEGLPVEDPNLHP